MNSANNKVEANSTQDSMNLNRRRIGFCSTIKAREPSIVPKIVRMMSIAALMALSIVPAAPSPAWGQHKPKQSYREIRTKNILDVNGGYVLCNPHYPGAVIK